VHHHPRSDLEAGSPASLAFEVTDGAGTPLPDSEVDFLARSGDGVPVVEGRLHNHDDGRFPVNVAFPGGGEATLAGNPETLQPAPRPYYLGPEPGSRPAFDLQVAPGAAVGRAGDDGALATPIGPAAALAGMVGAAAARRRG
jgi:hypothetical protein